MPWQDIVISIVNIVFAVSLIPQVYHGFKNKTGPIRCLTSVPTFIGLYVMVFAFFTLTLHFSAITAFITGSLWLTLFIQRVVYRKDSHEANNRRMSH